MNKKMKECFTPHIMIHSLSGLGIGLILAAIFPSLASVAIGVVVLIVSIILDYTQK